MTGPGRISRRLVFGASLSAPLAAAADPSIEPKASRSVTVVELGADPTGAASAVGAFDAAIVWANARATANAGVEVLVPDGTYRIDRSLIPITASNVRFRGSRGAMLDITAAGSVFTWTGDADGGGIDGMTLRYPAEPAGAAVLVTISGAYRLAFQDLEVINLGTLCVLGTGAERIASVIRFDKVTGSVFNSGRPTFDVGWGSDLTLNAIDMFVDGVPVPALDRASTMATAPGTNFVQCVKGGWDTLRITGGSACNRYWHAVHVEAPGAVVQNLWLDDCIFDYCASDAVSLNAPTHSAGGVFVVSCRGSYIASWSGSGIRLTGDNLNEIHDFSESTVYMAGAHGVHLSGRQTRDIRLNGLRICNPGRLAEGAYAGIRVDPIAGDWEVIGGGCLHDASGGLTWSAAFGIDIAAGNDRYVVQGASYAGTVANYRIAPDALASTNRRVAGNLHADYAGIRAAGLYRKPASGARWVNTTPFMVTVTVAGMDRGLGMDGADFSPLAGGAWDIPPGHGLHVAYSGPSKMQFFVKP